MIIGKYTVELHLLAGELREAGRKDAATLLLAVAQRLVRLECTAQVLGQETEKIKNLLEE